MTAGIIVSIAVLIFYVPTVIFLFTLVTSIQMLKRRDYIEMVIKDHRHMKSLRSMRMYQVFKLIRRELIEHFRVNVEDTNINITNRQIIRENFMMFDFEGNAEIDMNKITQFYPLNGVNLKKLESYVLLKKAHWDDENENENEDQDRVSHITFR